MGFEWLQSILKFEINCLKGCLDWGIAEERFWIATELAFVCDFWTFTLAGTNQDRVEVHQWDWIG
jgi:hypothetical protein